VLWLQAFDLSLIAAPIFLPGTYLHLVACGLHMQTGNLPDHQPLEAKEQLLLLKRRRLRDSYMSSPYYIERPEGKPRQAEDLERYSDRQVVVACSDAWIRVARGNDLWCDLLHRSDVAVLERAVFTEDGCIRGWYSTIGSLQSGQFLHAFLASLLSVWQKMWLLMIACCFIRCRGLCTLVVMWQCMLHRYRQAPRRVKPNVANCISLPGVQLPSELLPDGLGG